MQFLRNESYLSGWLLLVGSLRLLSTVLGYAFPGVLKGSVFPRAKVWTDLNARTFAVWTTVTCVITFVAAFNLANRALLLTAAGSFFIAGSFFLAELLIYKSVSLQSIAPPLFFSSAS